MGRCVFGRRNAVSAPVELYDATLRDGMGGGGMSLTAEEKVRVVRRLDDLGVHLIEAGFPASNPKEQELFELLAGETLAHSEVVGFGMTRRRGVAAGADDGLRILAGCFAPVITLVGKASVLHVEKVVRVEREENLAMIAESIAFLVGEGKRALLDAEHFFDGWIADPHDAVKIHTMIKSDSVAMGENLMDYLAAAMGYKGNLVHTQGLLSHSVAQERAEGIKKALAKYPDIKVIDETPADWDTTKVQSIWEDLLAKGEKIDAGIFHNDSMADAAANVLQTAGKLSEVKIASIDGMPFATDNVVTGKFYVVAMNSCCRIFSDALWAGYYAVTEKETTIPKLIVEPSPLITKDNAEGYAWFQKHFMW